MKPIIEVHNISKQYRLGVVGTGSLHHDINRWWHRLRGKEDPYLRIGQMNDRTTKGESDYVWALRDISFAVQPGEVLGIIGRNGAGKSTLLKILSRITAPTTGSIHLRGRVAALLEVGTGMHPELTGRENIYLNGAILGMRKKEIDRKLDAIVDFAGVERYIDTPVKRYSSGMHVRLGFAVAAHLEPEILIVDEVLAVGDVEFQKKCLGKMKDVSANDGRTVLFVSHNMAAIRSLCQRGVLLHQGAKWVEGEIETVVEKYIETAGDAFDDTSMMLWGDKGRGHDCTVEVLEKSRNLKFYCNDPIAFSLKFTAPEKFKKPGLSLLVRKIDGTPLAGTASQVQNLEFSGESDTWIVRADFGKIPLNAGNFSVDVYLLSGEQQLARFSKVLQIEIIPSDVFGWGKSLPDAANWGSFFWETQWTFEAKKTGKAYDHH